MNSQSRYRPGDKIGGRYQVHRALMGGMGEVYLCLDLEEMYPYALKTFQQRYLSAPKKLQAIFEQEVATWVALEKHPNIVRCFWMQTFDNQPFMCLEWIAGEEGKGADLRGWLRRGPLELRTALDFCIDVCRGLIHAQEKQPGLVHRDLKPENVLVAQGGLAKITDFGLAQIVATAGLEKTEAGGESEGRQNMVGRGGVAGTPPYMAPEQWRGESLDERTDIYAIGCILYEMLSGQPPVRVDFAPTTPQAFRRWLSAMQVGHESGPPPVLPPGLPGELSKLLGACLAKGRPQRPGSLADLLAQFEALYWQQFNVAPAAVPVVDHLTTSDYNNRGVTYYNLGQYEAALRDYGHAIELDPELAQAYLNRGMVYDDLQRYDEALADYEHAIRLDPSCAQAHSSRGLTYRKLCRYEEALADYNQAIQLDADNAHAYSNRGLVHADLGRYEVALADCSHAIQLDPESAQAYSNRGVAYDELQQYDEALADYDRAIELDHNLAQAYSNRGATYYKLQQYDKALNDFSRAIKLAPTAARVYYNRAVVYDDLQQYGEALADYDLAIQLDPTYAQAFGNRGIVFYHSQRFDEAVRDFSHAIQLDPHLAQAYFHRSIVYTELQRQDEALADLSQTIDLDPTHAEAYFNIGALLGKRNKLQEALPYFEKAAQLGLPQGARYVEQIRRILKDGER